MENLPKFLLQILEQFRIKNLIFWLSDLIVFLFKPKKFIKRFFRQKIKNQIIQLVFYTGILLLTYLIFFSFTDYLPVFRMFYMILLLTVPFVIINSFSFFVLHRKKFNLWKVFSFVYLSLTIFIIPSLILLKFFFLTENFSFVFFSNLCFVIALLYIMFFIWNTFSKSSIRIIGGYILNIIGLNLLFLVMGLVMRDPYSKLSSFDPIINEYNEYGKNIMNIRGKPYSLVEKTNMLDQTVVQGINFIDNDTLIHYDNAGLIIFRDNLRNNIKYIDSIKPALIFNRNKEIFSDLLMYSEVINDYFDTSPNSNYLIDEVVYISEIDSTVLMRKKEFIIEDKYFFHLDNYNKKLEELLDAIEYSTHPFIIYDFLLAPLKWSIDYFGIKTEEVRLFVQ